MTVEMLDAERWAYVDATAAGLARSHGHRHDVDEYIAEARARVVAEIARRPAVNDWNTSQLAQLVRRRLIDWHRAQHGRYTPKAHNRTVNLDDYRDTLPALGPEPGFDRECLRVWLVRVCVRHRSHHWAATPLERWEQVIALFVAGASWETIAVTVGVDASRVSQLVTQLCGWAAMHADEFEDCRRVVA